MCFSATASFTATALLVPAGVYCLKQAYQFDLKQRFVAWIPLIFGIQQAFEGFLWLAMEPGGSDYADTLALSFLFFSHFFWLLWIPYSSFSIESDPARKKVFYLLTIMGAVHGGLMFIPLLFHPEWLHFYLTQHSIAYQTQFFYDAFVSDQAVRITYALIILAPLLLSSEVYMRKFGVIIFLALIVAALFYSYAFVSVWCYMSAVVSLYILIASLRLRSQVPQLP